MHQNTSCVFKRIFALWRGVTRAILERSANDTFCQQTNWIFWMDFKWLYFIIRVRRTIDSKIPFTLNMWQILRGGFLALSSFTLCYPGQLQIKDLPSIIDCEPIRSFMKLFSQNPQPYLGERVFLLQLVHKLKYINDTRATHQRCLCIYVIFTRCIIMSMLTIFLWISVIVYISWPNNHIGWPLHQYCWCITNVRVIFMFCNKLVNFATLEYTCK